MKPNTSKEFNTEKCLAVAKDRDILILPLSKIDLLDIRHGKFLNQHWHRPYGIVFAIIGSRRQTQEERMIFDRTTALKFGKFIGLNVILGKFEFDKIQEGVLVNDYSQIPEAKIQLHIIDAEEYERETGRNLLKETK